MQPPSPLRQELEDLLRRFQQLAQHLPDRLVWLTEVVSPAAVIFDQRVHLLNQMLIQLPGLLASTNPTQLENLVQQPPLDAVPLRLLLDLRQLPILFKGLTEIRLIQLKHHLPPGGSGESHLKFLKKVQTFLLPLSQHALLQLSTTIKATHQNQQRSKLIEQVPNLPHDIANFVIQLLILSISELISFKAWIESLTDNQFILLVNLLTSDLDTLSDLRYRLTDQGQGKRTWLDAIGFDSLSMSGGQPPLSKMQRIGSSHGAFHDDMMVLNQSGDDFSNFSIASFQFEEPPFVIEEGNDNPFDFGISDLHVSDNFQPFKLPIKTEHVDHMNTDTEFIETIIRDENSVSPNPASFNNPLTHPPQPQPVMNHPTIHVTQPPPHHPHSMPMPYTNPPVTRTATKKMGEQSPHHPQFAQQPPPPKYEPPKAPLVQQSTDEIPLSVSQSLPAAPNFQLTVQKQPPAQTVYQRILKPCPSVMLANLGAGEAPHNLFVEATLIRCEGSQELPSCLEGTRVVPLGTSNFANFNKLKILATSQQQGSLFRIKFQLKRYEGNIFITLPGYFTVSNPIQVFSHTYYLPKGRKNNTPATCSISEVLPPMGPATGGTRIVILGSNFVESSKLCVRFGDQIIPATFHESKTLICTTIPGIPGRQTFVSVSNDGIEFCAPTVFCYLPPR